VFGVIQANTHHLSHPPDARPNPHRLLHDGQRLGIDTPQPIEGSCRQGLARDVVDDAHQATNLASGIYHTGLLLAGLAVAEKFHDSGRLRRVLSRHKPMLDGGSFEHPASSNRHQASRRKNIAPKFPMTAKMLFTHWRAIVEFASAKYSRSY
jgi:hypothetical protein